MRFRYLLSLSFLGALLALAFYRMLRTLWLSYLGSGQQPICPYCGAKKIRRSNTLLMGDRLYRLLCFFPYRCRGCYARFYRFTPLHRVLPDQAQAEIPPAGE